MPQVRRGAAAPGVGSIRYHDDGELLGLTPALPTRDHPKMRRRTQARARREQHERDRHLLVAFARDKGTIMNTLEAAWKTNLEVRPEEDWKDLKGRAVSKNE